MTLNRYTSFIFIYRDVTITLLIAQDRNKKYFTIALELRYETKEMIISTS
ncbi:Uncharacterised protein [Staphylococcus simiae]|nr:Uncharacterised protein [Staphylococcus simiae]